MLDNLRPTDPIYRDGVTQARRWLAALGADTVAWEDRSLEDWLRFAQEFSRHVHYYNEKHQPDGYWEGFLQHSGPWQALAESDEELAAQQEAWRQGMVAYAKGELPETADAWLAEQFSQPHRVLFVAFLSLLDQFQPAFNQLFSRHHRYHIHDLLQFRKRPALGDQVIVGVTLEEDSDPVLLPKGARLEAGQDAEDNDLVYTLDADTWVSETQLAEVRALHLIRC
ncbi:MAG: hypothetical protein AAFQ98_21570, partial [Bacteroidota bacterium]